MAWQSNVETASVVLCLDCLVSIEGDNAFGIDFALKPQKQAAVKSIVSVK